MPAKSARSSTSFPNHIRIGNRNIVLDTRPDTVDFRDRQFVPTLVEVPPSLPVDDYRDWEIPVLNQGREGACTGFGLATVVHYLLRTRSIDPDRDPVSPRMLYELARRYDEWPGEDYSGSSARGAMKGWHKHGVCSDSLWPYQPGNEDGTLTRERSQDATNRPLGAYFRVNHRDIVAMHAALAEVGILYATALVHTGWSEVDEDGDIPLHEEHTGGHAFAIVAYDRNGLWIQNSWGNRWGNRGFARISYNDWLQNGKDVWVARLGAPVDITNPRSLSIGQNLHSGNPDSYTAMELRPHIVCLGNDGRLQPEGTFGTDPRDLDVILEESIPAITAGWKKKRLLLHAHGGLVGRDSACQRLAESRATLLDNEVYPVSFIWNSDYWSTLRHALEDAVRSRRPDGALNAAQDFLWERLDDMLEVVARHGTGKMQWDEMKENATAAAASTAGGACQFLRKLDRFLDNHSGWEVHLLGHSAGSILLGPVAALLASKGRITSGPLKGKTGMGRKIDSLTLWAPACTTDFFHQCYAALVRSKQIAEFALYNLTDQAEQDDHCAHIYHKSLLHLVSNAFEVHPRIPLLQDGTPLLGMERFVHKDGKLVSLLEMDHCRLILSPDSHLANSTSHGGFDNDEKTQASTLARILGKQRVAIDKPPAMGTTSIVEQRLALDAIRE